MSNSSILNRILPYIASIVIGGILIGIAILPLFNNDENFVSQVSVGVVDSGCDKDRDYVKEYKTFTTIEFGYPTDELTVYDTYPPSGHGKYVCSIINNYSPKADLYSARIASSKEILTYEGLFAAITWLAEEIGVDIINLSLGSEPIYSDLLINVIEKYSEKVIFVASSGNTGNSNYNTFGLGDWPATLPSTIGVGAVESSNEIASYSAKGRSHFGQYVSEFADLGEYNGIHGTSFSTPVISGKIAYLLGLLHKRNIHPTVSEITTILAQTSDRWQSNNFDDIIGWGVPSFESDIGDYLKPKLIIHGKDDTDSLSRFSGEKWSINWKITSYGLSKSEVENFKFSGNATNSMINHSISIGEWGGLLTVSFNESTKPGLYELDISHPLGNGIKYSFNLLSEAKGRILFDHRFSINGYGHPYGEFFQLEKLIRENGYSVSHQLVDQEFLNLESYDSVFSPRFYQKINVHKLTFNRDIQDELTNSYIEYIENGGSFIAFLDIPENTFYEEDIPLFHEFKINYTGNEIAKNGHAITASNFSTNLLFKSVAGIQFIGGEVASLDNMVEDIGWYRQVISGPIATIYHYRSIGVTGSLGNGNFIVFGATNLISNEYLKNFTSMNMDRFITNYLSSLN